MHISKQSIIKTINEKTPGTHGYDWVYTPEPEASTSRRSLGFNLKICLAVHQVCNLINSSVYAKINYLTFEGIYVGLHRTLSHKHYLKGGKRSHDQGYLLPKSGAVVEQPANIKILKYGIHSQGSDKELQKSLKIADLPMALRILFSIFRCKVLKKHKALFNAK